jgi:hypothetical protein
MGGDVIDEPNSRHQDPDPLSAILAILGAVGSIASIVALVDQRRSVRANNQRQARDDVAEIIEHLATAEAALAELSSVAFRLMLLAKGSQPTGKSLVIPLPDHGGPVFGQHGLALYESDIQEYFRLQDSAFRHGRSLQKSLSAAFQVIYRSNAVVREEDFQRLVRIVHGVNGLLRRHDSLDELLLSTAKVCDEASATIHQLRQLLAQAGGITGH